MAGTGLWSLLEKSPKLTLMFEGFPLIQKGIEQVALRNPIPTVIHVILVSLSSPIS